MNTENDTLQAEAEAEVSEGGIKKHYEISYKLLITISLILGLSGLGISLWNNFNMQSLKNLEMNHPDQSEPLRAEITNLKQDLVSINTQIAPLAALNVKEKLETLEQNVSTQHAEMQTISESGKSDNIGLIMEAKYLLNLSQKHLQILQDPKTAILLLSAATERLKLVNDERLTSIREGIANEKVQLEKVPSIDYESLWSSLGALSEKVQALSLRYVQKNIVMQPVVEEKSHDTYKETFMKSLAQFKDLIKIRQHNAPIEPLLGTSEQDRIKEYLNMQFETARWALLYQKKQIYQKSIQAIIKTLTQHFNTEDAVVKDIVSTVSSLEKMVVFPDFTEIVKSIQQSEQLLGDIGGRQ